MVEKYEHTVHTEHVVLDIGQDIGSLVIYTREELLGYQIDVSLKGNATAKRVHTDVLERRIGGRPVFAAVFAALPEGEYMTWSDPAETCTIVGFMHTFDDATPAAEANQNVLDRTYFALKT